MEKLFKYCCIVFIFSMTSLIWCASCVKIDKHIYTHQYVLKIHYRNGDVEKINLSYQSYLKDCEIRISTIKTITCLKNCENHNLNIYDVRRFEIIKHTCLKKYL